MKRAPNEFRSRLRAAERGSSHPSRTLAVATRHSDEARNLGHPDIDAGPGGAWSRLVELADREVLTVADEAGPLGGNTAGRTIARGPRDLVREELLANGYTICHRRHSRLAPPGR